MSEREKLITVGSLWRWKRRGVKNYRYRVLSVHDENDKHQMFRGKVNYEGPDAYYLEDIGHFLSTHVAQVEDASETQQKS